MSARAGERDVGAVIADHIGVYIVLFEIIVYLVKGKSRVVEIEKRPFAVVYEIDEGRFLRWTNAWLGIA